MLRCNPRVPACAHKSPTALRGGDRWGGASGGGETQAGSLPRTRKGRPAEAGRARGRSGRPLEWRRAAVRPRSAPFARVPRAPHSSASSGSGLGEKVVERAVGRCASGRRHHCPWPGALRLGRLGLHAAAAGPNPGAGRNSGN